MTTSKYEVFLVNHENDYFFCLYENATEQAIDFYFFKDDADEKKAFLENGGAFSGFTPSFMLREVPLSKTGTDLNKSFEELIQ